MPNILNIIKYYFFSFSSNSLYSFHIIDKNHFLFNKKRDAAMQIFPDAKLLSEIGSTGHTLYHPLKKDKDIESIKLNLGKLIKEANKRKIKKNKTLCWANSLLEEKYSCSIDSGTLFVPNYKQLKSYKKIADKRTTNRFVSSKKIEKKIIYDLIECAIQAPSSCNRQGWRFVIIEDKKKIEEVAKLKNQYFIKNFNYLILCCFDKNVYMGTDKEMTPYLDCGAALMNLCNAASALGLSACWLNFAIKNTKKKNHFLLRKLLGLPENLMPVSFIGLGIPGKKLIKPPRENLFFYLPLEKNENK